MLSRTIWYGLLAVRWVIAMGVLLGYGLIADVREWTYVSEEIVGILVLGFAISLVAGPQTYDSYRRWSIKTMPGAEREERGEERKPSQ